MSPMAALLAVFWPALASMAILLLGLALRRWRLAGEAAGAAAVAVGLLVADFVVRGTPPLSPAEATRWLPHVGIMLALVGIVRIFAGKPLWVFGLTGIALGTSTLLLLGPGMRWQNAGGSATGTLVLAALALTAVYVAGRRAGRATPAWLSPLLLAVVCLGGGVALAQSYFASVGQILTGLAGTLGAVAVMGAWWVRMGSSAGAMPAAAGLFALCILVGRVYSELPTSSAVLLLGAAMVPAALQMPGVRRLPVALRAALGLLCAAGLVAIAVILTPMGLDFSA